MSLLNLIDEHARKSVLPSPERRWPSDKVIKIFTSGRGQRGQDVVNRASELHVRLFDGSTRSSNSLDLRLS